MITSETTFATDVLAAPLPAVVVFQSPTCDASRALMQLVTGIAPAFVGKLVVASVDVDDDALIADQYNIEAVPSLMVFEGGEPLTRLVGFAAPGLIAALFAEAAAGHSQHAFWRPTEAVFEDTVIIPLLHGWNWPYSRQEACVVAEGRRSRRGRVDVLVHSADAARPLTLFENKRLIMSQRDVTVAVAQAHGYAVALHAPSFVVAAPSGMWVYVLRHTLPALAGRFSSLDVYHHPDVLRQLLLRLHAA